MKCGVMHNLFNINAATHLVNTIVNSVRCAHCDSTRGARLRHSCRHTICSSCADIESSCLICTPPSSPKPAVQDVSLSKIAEHVTELLDTFQDTFHINVAIQTRISEQRKLEKEVFPQCIQTPTITYHNKRKTLSLSNKSINRISLPGEELGIKTKEMDKSIRSNHFVQDWLEQHNDNFIKYHPRAPFSDIPVNSPIHKSTPLKNRNSSNLHKDTPRTYQKRTHYKTDKVLTNKAETSLWKSAKRLKKEPSNKESKNESGIVIDDETIVIEDSLHEIDKDRQAWLAVLEAEKRPNCSMQSFIEETQKKVERHKPVQTKPAFSSDVLNWLHSDSESAAKISERKNRKVPFYKKGALVNPYIKRQMKSVSIQDRSIPRAVSISIHTNDIVTKISVTNTQKVGQKISKGIQTDTIDEITQTDDVIEVNEVKKNLSEVVLKPVEVVKDFVFSESSDSEIEMSQSLLVEAQVHRSNDDLERSILTELRGAENRTTRVGKRGPTPNSSDSSEKENRDPNRKKTRVDKKKNKKFRL